MLKVGVINLKFDGLSFARYLSSDNELEVYVYDGNLNIQSVINNKTYLSIEERNQPPTELFKIKSCSTIGEVARICDVIFIMSDNLYDIDDLDRSHSVLTAHMDIRQELNKERDSAVKKAVVLCSVSPMLIGLDKLQNNFSTVIFPYVHGKDAMNNKYYAASTSVWAIETLKKIMIDMEFVEGIFTIDEVVMACYLHKYKEVMDECVASHINNISQKLPCGRISPAIMKLMNVNKVNLSSSEVHKRIQDMEEVIKAPIPVVANLITGIKGETPRSALSAIRTLHVDKVNSRYCRDAVKFNPDPIRHALYDLHHVTLDSKHEDIKAKLTGLSNVIDKLEMKQSSIEAP